MSQSRHSPFIEAALHRLLDSNLSAKFALYNHLGKWMHCHDFLFFLINKMNKSMVFIKNNAIDHDLLAPLFFFFFVTLLIQTRCILPYLITNFNHIFYVCLDDSVFKWKSIQIYVIEIKKKNGKIQVKNCPAIG